MSYELLGYSCTLRETRIVQDLTTGDAVHTASAFHFCTIHLDCTVVTKRIFERSSKFVLGEAEDRGEITEL